MLCCGDRVECLRQDGNLHSGTIADVLSNNLLFSITFDDGTIQKPVPAHAIHKRPCRLPEIRPGLLKKGRRRHKLMTALRNAANEGDVATVKLCLEHGAPHHFFDSEGYTPLHWATGPQDGVQADTEDRQQCVAMLGRVSEIDAPDKSVLSMRAIDHAILHHFAASVSILIRLGANLSGTVHLAVSVAAYAALRLLVAEPGDAPFDPSPRWNGLTPMMMCCSQGDSRALSILLHATEARGFQVKYEAVNAVQAEERKQTALHLAVESASAMCVQMLLKSGADPRQPCGSGEDAFGLARKLVAATHNDERRLLFEQCEELLSWAVQSYAQAIEDIRCMLGSMIDSRNQDAASPTHHRKRQAEDSSLNGTSTSTEGGLRRKRCLHMADLEGIRDFDNWELPPLSGSIHMHDDVPPAVSLNGDEEDISGD